MRSRSIAEPPKWASAKNTAVFNDLRAFSSASRGPPGNARTVGAQPESPSESQFTGGAQAPEGRLGRVHSGARDRAVRVRSRLPGPDVGDGAVWQTRDRFEGLGPRGRVVEDPPLCAVEPVDVVPVGGLIPDHMGDEFLP